MHSLTQNVTMNKRQALETSALWFDASHSTELLTRALHSGYNGVLTDVDTFCEVEGVLGERITAIVDVGNEATQTTLLQQRKEDPNFVVASRDKETLNKLSLAGFTTAFRAYVTDAQSLHDAIEVGRTHSYVLMSFKDPTNIPLELVIASLQSSQTILIKEIAPDDIDDAIVTLGVMEVGADGIMVTPKSHSAMDAFLTKRANTAEKTLPLSVGEVVEARPVGMGYRSCIDLATLFTETEGMLVGSTSHGGIFCCPEVFHLPYMELRPFRVNAGAVHSYVYNLNNRTDYMTELKAGSPVMIADSSGRVRRAYVGRVKTEVRPLRLIEVKFSAEKRVNILLQDDWHVRVYSDEAKPRNITELKPGDKLLGFVADPGRHVGIKVSEHILEM